MVSFSMNTNKSLAGEPKYASIAARYRQQIQSGVLRPGDRLPSFAEVRAQLGVGQSTLERAHQLLESETLILREPGRGVFVAPQRRRPKTGIIGLYGIDAVKGHHPYFSRLLEGVHLAAQEAGIEILLLHENVPLAPDKVDGILLYSTMPDVALRKLPPEVPCVSLLTSARGISSVTVDDSEGVAAAVRHLVEQGHRRIAYLVGRSHQSVAQCRTTAYRNALCEAGIMPQDEWLRNLPELSSLGHREIYRAFVEWGHEAMIGWLANGWTDLGCTALLAHNDDTAIGATRALQEAGWKVPKQVSVVGYDDTLSAELFHPPLTTVHVPLREIGSRAMELLLNEIESETASGSAEPELVFTPTLQVRASTTPHEV
jgi:LacI family transcriptional regulator